LHDALLLDKILVAGGGSRLSFFSVTHRLLMDISTELSTGLGIFLLCCVVFAVFLVRWQWRLALYAREAVEFVQLQNKRSVSLRRLAEVETTLTELLDAYESLLQSHKKLRSRIGMRNLRDKRGNGVDSESVPADESAKAAYKSKLRAKLQSEGRL